MKLQTIFVSITDNDYGTITDNLISITDNIGDVRGGNFDDRIDIRGYFYHYIVKYNAYFKKVIR